MSKMLTTMTTESTTACICLGQDELKACVLDVSVISFAIQKFTELGLMTADGTAYDFDIIFCCTGYDVSFASHTS